MTEPLITAIVSTYRAERFMRGCLEDLVAQTMLDRMEILVIDSGSPEDERSVCEEFASRYPQVRYLRTENEPLYAAWNRAIGLARGTYLTNANTDDRHRPDFMATMVDALERHPEVGLVYGEQMLSTTANETFAECERRGAKVIHFLDYDPAHLMVACITGSQPVWRKALHDECGLFDTRYRICADRDMWIRFAAKHPLMKLPGTFGVVYISEDTLSGTGQRIRMNLEDLDIQQKYIRQSPWRDLPGIRKRMSETTFQLGYQHVERERNSRAGLPFFREAIKLDPTNFRYLKTYLVRSVVSLYGMATKRQM